MEKKKLRKSLKSNILDDLEKSLTREQKLHEKIVDLKNMYTKNMNKILKKFMIERKKILEECNKKKEQESKINEINEKCKSNIFFLKEKMNEKIKNIETKYENYVKKKDEEIKKKEEDLLKEYNKKIQNMIIEHNKILNQRKEEKVELKDDIKSITNETINLIDDFSIPLPPPPPPLPALPLPNIKIDLKKKETKLPESTKMTIGLLEEILDKKKKLKTTKPTLNTKEKKKDNISDTIHDSIKKKFKKVNQEEDDDDDDDDDF